MNNFSNIPDLTGKVAIVTGANSGTGYGITYHLAKHNCKVIMASRNEMKLTNAKKQLLSELPNAILEVEVVDLTDLTSIKNFTDRIIDKYKKVDYLANNAGGGGRKYELTVDGLESTLTLNYLGHFAITTQLIPVLKESSRIVTFSSIGYKRFLKNDLDVENLMCTDPKEYNTMQEYCKGKLCSILFSLKLQQEFERIGSKSLSLACHPGFARTNLAGQSGTLFAKGFGKVFNGISALFRLSHSLYEGALPAIEALITDNPQSGKVYSPSAKNEMTGNPVPRKIDHTHYKDEDIDKLWNKSIDILHLDITDYLK